MINLSGSIEELRQTLDRSEEALSNLKRDKKRGEELTRAEIEKLHSLCNEVSGFIHLLCLNFA